MFRFASPFYFLLFAPLLVAAWRIYRRTRRRGVTFPLAGRMPPTRRSWRSITASLTPLLTLLGLALGIFALARPQTVFSQSHKKTDAIAIHMVVDVSGSMEALDLSEKGNQRTRLDVVKETFTDFVQERPDDLIGLVTFGGFATTRVPLTTDHAALSHVLSGVEIPSPSRDRRGQIVNQEELLTAIGDALATGCARLKDAEPTTRIVVLLSDGESNTGVITPEQALQAAAKLGIKVYTIGVGSSGRAPFKTRNMMGRDVVQYAHVTLDERLLRRIATETGGRYFNVRDADGLEEALAEINELETTEIERDVFEHFDEQFGPWLLSAIGLIVTGVATSMSVARRVA
jgi:Ca-activated chloride channel family protein